MATNTYVALDKTTVSSATPSVTLSSISGAYTDLVLVISGSLTSNNQTYRIQFNGDAGGNYSYTTLGGTSGGPNSVRGTNTTFIPFFVLNGAPNTSISANVISINNYSNTTTNKTCIIRANYGNGEISSVVGSWASNVAITSITVYASAGNIAANSTFSLYGIAAEGTSPAAKATGGVIYSDADYYYHVFDSTNTFTPLQSLSADILVVAGGGGGGLGPGGGGGAGGLQTFTSQSLSATAYTCTVGGGGAGGTIGSGGVGSQGANSQFGALTASVGGGYSTGGGDGGAGGSGGGASPNGNGGAGTSGQGFAGGNVTVGGAGTYYMTASGGGAGAAGTTPSGGACSNGGIGGTSAFINAIGLATGTGQTISGTTYFAGGGGGGNAAWNNGSYAQATPGVGGYGGGGNGANRSVDLNATNSVANMGGGGGGGAYFYNGSNVRGAGGKGGSGIVIVRYAKA